MCQLILLIFVESDFAMGIISIMQMQVYNTLHLPTRGVMFFSLYSPPGVAVGRFQLNTL